MIGRDPGKRAPAGTGKIPYPSLRVRYQAANLLPQVALSLVHLGQFERAAEITDRVIALAPDDPWSYGLKAWSRQLAGALEEARSALQAMPASVTPGACSFGRERRGFPPTLDP